MVIIWLLGIKRLSEVKLKKLIKRKAKPVDVTLQNVSGQ